MAARIACGLAASGCTCGSALPVGTSDAATTHPNGTRVLMLTPLPTPIIRSLEPGEDWNWCYVDEVAFLIDGIRGETRIPSAPLLQ